MRIECQMSQRDK